MSDKAETYRGIIKSHVESTLDKTNLPYPDRREGKVRDSYVLDEKRMLFVTTDRLSAFDRILTSIPFKGRVLNLTSAWWFNITGHIIDNHLLSIPHPNVAIVQRCTPCKVEFVVRGYMTGSTDTSLWTHYKNGERTYCGNKLPEGMKKNQKLPHAIITPTTKDEVHDRPISPQEIVESGLMTQAQWDSASASAMKLFEYGTREAKKRNLILVDTKYEMGISQDGKLMLIDEIHTPDSSRFWIADSYEQRIASGEEPQSLDKEFIRLWFRQVCDPYHDEVLPKPPQDLIVELSLRYIDAYERITGKTFQFPKDGLKNLEAEIAQTVAETTAREG